MGWATRRARTRPGRHPDRWQRDRGAVASRDPHPADRVRTAPHPVGAGFVAIAPRDMELARGDLARILYEASANDSNYIFRDSIKALIQDAMGVDVTFEHSRRGRKR
jgi:hypothetical protein